MNGHEGPLDKLSHIVDKHLLWLMTACAPLDPME
jgi:hypothetical protein